MRYLVRIIEVFLLAAFVILTIKNSQQVEFNLPMKYSWNAPLIVFLLIFFVFGAIVGLIATFSYYFKMRSELSHIKKELRKKLSANESAVDINEKSID